MQRHERLFAEMERAGFDALAIVPGANAAYLTGIDFTTRLRLSMVLVSRRGAALIVPAMEARRAAAVATLPLQSFPWVDGADPRQALRAAGAALGLRGARVGIEPTVMRVFELHALEAAIDGITCADATGTLMALRSAKDADELAAMREAVAIIEATLQQVLAELAPGQTERAIAERWDALIRAAGSVPAFETAVAAGAHGASPHHTSGDRALQRGDLVVLDGGAVVRGYVSDITRTVAIGPIDDEARAVYAAVEQANLAGRQAAALPEASGDSVDRAARAVIDAAGYGPAFLHRTGHGIGREIHEPPFIVAGSTAPLPVGATFTVEPGVYLAGRFGVRIEDDLVRTADGAASLTTFPRGLITVDA